MVEYGVNVSNKFAFLEGDDDAHDPEEVLEKAEKESKEKAKTAKDTVKKPPVPQPVVQEKKVTIAPEAVNKDKSDNRRNNQQQYQNKRDGGPGGFKGGPRAPRRQNNDENAPPATGDAFADRFGESRPPRNNENRGNFDRRNRGEGERYNRNNAGRGNDQGWQKRDGDRPQREYRNESDTNAVSDGDGNQQAPRDRAPRDRPFRRGGNGGGGGGPRGPPRGDRISGSDKTGVRPVPKKDGHGKGNWGSEQDDMGWGTNETTEPQADLNKTAEEVTQPEGDAANETSEEQVNGEAEAEKVQLTLEEWKAQQKQNQPQFNVRKPGEGADQKIYQTLVPLKSEKVEKDTSESEEEQARAKRSTRERPLNIEVSFADSQRNRGGGHRGEGGNREGGERRNPNFERGGDRRSGGNRPSGGGGYAKRGNDAGPSGSGRRSQNNKADFQLSEESFPTLGAH